MGEARTGAQPGSARFTQRRASGRCPRGQSAMVSRGLPPGRISHAASPVTPIPHGPVFHSTPTKRSTNSSLSPLKGRQAELVDCQAPRSEPPKDFSFTWRPIHQSFRPIPINPPPRRSAQRAAPRGEVWNPRFQRFFGYFLCAQKVPGRPAAAGPVVRPKAE